MCTLEPGLPEPSARQAAHMLRQLSWEERLVGHRVSPSAGTTVVDLYSLEEAAEFVHVDSHDAPAQYEFTYVCYVDPIHLKAWADAMMADPELARALDDLLATTTDPMDVQEPVKDLLQLRLAQCRNRLARSGRTSVPAAVQGGSTRT